MKINLFGFLAVGSLLLLSSHAHSQDEQPELNTKDQETQTRIMSKDGRYYGIQVPVPDPHIMNDGQKRLRDETRRKSLENMNNLKEGDILLVEDPTDTSSAEDPGYLIRFELNESEIIEGCNYSVGFSFPYNCTDEEENIIFTAGKDPQSVLDQLMVKQGIKSQHNKVPDDYIDGQSYPNPREPYPLEALKELSAQFKKRQNSTPSPEPTATALPVGTYAPRVPKV